MPEGPLRSGLYLGELPRIILPFDLLRGGLPFQNALSARAANEAIFMPFEVDDFWQATGLNWSVYTSAGNFDVGIYDANGNRIVSKGTTATPAVGVANGAFTSTRLTRGRYFAAFVIDNATVAARFNGVGPQNGTAVTHARVLQERGMFQMAAALPLPAVATFAECAWVAVPILALELA